MRRSLAVLAAILGLAQAITVGQSGAVPRTLVATSNVTLRASASATAPKVASISAGTKLRIAKCGNGWCEVVDPARHGFVAERYLATVVPAGTAPRQQARPAIPSSSGKGYRNSQGVHIPSPTRTENGRPPAGATAQCRDGSYSFSQSRRGTCSHHGGVARWLEPTDLDSTVLSRAFD